jgi:hypothetical protein
MNGEPRTDLIQLITRTESLPGDDDLAPAPADVESSPLGDYSGVIRLLGTHRPRRRFDSSAAHRA